MSCKVDGVGPACVKLNHSAAGPQVQDLASSRLPPGFRGRSAVYVQLWWIIQTVCMHGSPQILYGWRRLILRLFGAQIGKNVKIRPSVRITYPWKVEIGDHSWIGDGTELYSLGTIRIGSNVVVSQHSYLCAGTHDHHDRLFTIRSMPITIGNEAWIAAHSFIGPGVTIGPGAVVGARSVVLNDVPEGMLVAGHPARIRGHRNKQDI